MPSRCPIPSENPLAFFLATEVRPTVSSTSCTRLFGMPLLCARHSRWLKALRPPCMALASSRAPMYLRGSFSRS